MTQRRTPVTALSLNKEQRALLERLMREDHQINKTAFVVSLLVAEDRRRRKPERVKTTNRAQGAEHRTDDEELVPHPDDIFHKGEFITKEEHERWMKLRGVDSL